LEKSTLEMYSGGGGNASKKKKKVHAKQPIEKKKKVREGRTLKKERAQKLTDGGGEPLIK